MSKKQPTIVIFLFFLFIISMQSFAQTQGIVSPKVTECIEPSLDIEERYEELELKIDELESERKEMEMKLGTIKERLKEKLLLIEQLKIDVKNKAIKNDIRRNLSNKIKILQDEEKDEEAEGYLLTEKLEILQNALKNRLADKKDLELKYCFAALTTLSSPALEQKIYLIKIEAVSVSFEKLRFAGRGMAIVNGGGAYDYPSSKLAPPIGVKVEVNSDSTPIFNTCKLIITTGIPEGKALYLIGKGYRKSFGVYELESLSACELIFEKDIFR